VRKVWLAALAVVAMACGTEIIVGAEPTGDAAADTTGDAATDTRGDAAVDATGDATVDTTGDAAVDTTGDGGLLPLIVPWSTGFEEEAGDGFGDWSQPSTAGFCYATTGATFKIVTSPVHSGQHSAAFMVDTSMATSLPAQARCVRQGVLPPSAYYGAWYYVPVLVTSVGTTWNLFHFQGASAPDAAVNDLWDLSLDNQADGSLAPGVYDALTAKVLAAGPAIPIGTWFHLEVFLKPSAAGAGEISVYVDGNLVLDLSGITTDPTLWGQWYVGNYATSLSPSAATLYVDDVTIETSGP
jgi:hypothetical protein